MIERATVAISLAVAVLCVIIGQSTASTTSVYPDAATSCYAGAEHFSPTAGSVTWGDSVPNYFGDDYDGKCWSDGSEASCEMDYVDSATAGTTGVKLTLTSNEKLIITETGETVNALLDGNAQIFVDSAGGYAYFAVGNDTAGNRRCAGWSSDGGDYIISEDTTCSTNSGSAQVNNMTIGGAINLTGVSAAATCTTGEVRWDTDVTDQLCVCTATDTWGCANLTDALD